MHRAPKQNKGIALLEVLISLVIISVGLLGVAALQIGSFKDNIQSKQYEAASYALHQLVERLSSNSTAVALSYYDFNNLAAAKKDTLPNDSCTDNSTAECQAKQDLSVWYQQVKASLPSPRISISTNTSIASGAQITAQIVWDAALKNNSSADYAQVCDKTKVDSYQCNQVVIWLKN